MKDCVSRVRRRNFFNRVINAICNTLQKICKVSVYNVLKYVVFEKHLRSEVHGINLLPITPSFAFRCLCRTTYARKSNGMGHSHAFLQYAQQHHKITIMQGLVGASPVIVEIA